MEETPTYFELSGALWHNTQNLMHFMGWPLNDDGETWGMLGTHYDIVHNPGHGSNAFLHVFFVLAILTVIAACLVGILARDVELVSAVHAAPDAAMRSCKGRVLAMEQGIGFPGGYNVEIKCER